MAFSAAAGVDPGEIARRAGRASVAFTYDRYGHFLRVDKQAAVKLEALRERARLTSRDHRGLDGPLMPNCD